jgi:hypothetical protein
MVRQLSIDALEDAGYTVIHSEDARRGLSLLGAHPKSKCCSPTWCSPAA